MSLLPAGRSLTETLPDLDELLVDPHAYLDTVVLLGSVGGQEIGMGRVLFAAGAMLASLLWFLSLGFGARFAAPIFAKPIAWRILDGVIAVVMWSIAASLLIR